MDGGFTDAGYEYVTLDDWYAERDEHGKIRAIPSLFPEGMPATSKFIHDLGLKFGVYSSASQRTCGNFTASMFREREDAKVFADEWEIDFLKYDSCIYNNGVANRARYITMRDALNATGRRIFYSMEGDAHFADVGNMWRSGGDIWPKWDECVLRNLYLNNDYAHLQKPGAFNDPDMLQATGTEGGTQLTFEESKSQFVLWAVMKAPLILGVHWSDLADLRTKQPEYFELLTHSELISIDQDLSPQAVLVSQRPSKQQLSEGLQLSVQECDAARADQRFVETPFSAAGLHAIGTPHSSDKSYNCLASNGADVKAVTCTANASKQLWSLTKDSQLQVVRTSQKGQCLTHARNTDTLTVAPCKYDGDLPPPFEAQLDEQLFLWDEHAGSLVTGDGRCVTLGLPNLPPGQRTQKWVTNNGTLHHEVWAGPLSGDRNVVVLFNKGDAKAEVVADWQTLNFPSEQPMAARDVYNKKEIGVLAGSLHAEVEAHGIAVFVLSPPKQSVV